MKLTDQQLLNEYQDIIEKPNLITWNFDDFEGFVQYKKKRRLEEAIRIQEISAGRKDHKKY